MFGVPGGVFWVSRGVLGVLEGVSGLWESSRSVFYSIPINIHGAPIKALTFSKRREDPRCLKYQNFPEVMVVLTYWEASGEFSELRYKILLYFSSKRSYCRCTSLIWFTSFTCFTCRCVPTSQDVLIFIVLSPDLELLPGEIWPQQVHLIITLSIDSSKMIHLNG